MIEIRGLAWLIALALVIGCEEKTSAPEEAPPAADTIPGGPTASTPSEANP